MKNLFLTIILVIILASCGPKVYIDYDSEVDFEKYQTFNFYDPSNSGLNELDNNRLIDAIKTQLDSLDKKPKLIPDFSIEFFAENYMLNQSHNVGISVGGGVGGIGGGIPVNTKEEMLSLTINFADALTDELFWQAVVEAEYDTDMKPEEKKLYFQELVREALSYYPPKQDD